MRFAIYHNLSSGGAKRTLREQIRGLAERHSVDVFTLSSADHEFANVRPFSQRHRVYEFEPGRLRSFPFGRLNQLVRISDLMRLYALSGQIATDIAAQGYDAVLVHPCRFENAPSLLAQLKSRLRGAVYYCHEPLRQCHEAKPARPYDESASLRRRILGRIDPLPRLHFSRLRATDQRNTRAAASVLVNSGFVRDNVERIYGVGAQISYHGVDTRLFTPMDLSRERFVLSVGSLTPLKGFDFAIEAVALIPRASRPALVIASNFENAPERTYLRELARAREVELVLKGHVDDNQLVKLYNQCSAVVYAPFNEPFGLVPLEAMACGAPVVAVREGGIPETVLDGETGLLVDRALEQFAAAVERVLEDGGLARRLGRAGRRLVQRRWTWENAVQTLESRLTAAC